MIDFLKKAFWNIRCPWPESSVEMNVRALNLTVCGEDRFGECMELYERNEAHGLPSSHRSGYLEALKSGTLLTLIAEDQGQVVGTFGLQYLRKPDILILCYVLVSPDCHSSGVGTTMFFASLALLPEHHNKVIIGVYALPHSMGFYRRFGFRSYKRFQDTDNTTMILAGLPVNGATSARCRELLARAKATLPAGPITIPLQPRPAADTEKNLQGA